MYRNKYLLKFYKFIHNTFKQPMFLNILILGIFLVSIRFWYMFLLIFTTWLKDVYNFYFMFMLSIICGISYLLICYVIVNYYKKDYFDYHKPHLKFNKKFINQNNIYTWVHHKNNLINVTLHVLSHFLITLVHTTIYLHIISNKLYYNEWWYYYFMICYFLYIIDITLLFLYTFNGINIDTRPRVYDNDIYYIYIYRTSLFMSIPVYIYDTIRQLISELTFSKYWRSNPEQIFISELIIITYNLIGWPWTLILNFNNFVLNILQLVKIYNYDILTTISYMLYESTRSSGNYYYRCVIANTLYLTLILLILTYYFNFY